SDHVQQQPDRVRRGLGDPSDGRHLGVPGDGSVPPRHRLPGVLQGGPGPQGGHGALRGGGGGGLGGAEQGEEVAGGLFPFGGVGAAGVVLGEAVEAAVGGAEGLAGDVFGGVLVGGLPGGVAERGCGEAGGGSGVHGGLSGSGAGWFPRPRGVLLVEGGGVVAVAADLVFVAPVAVGGGGHDRVFAAVVAHGVAFLVVGVSRSP